MKKTNLKPFFRAAVKDETLDLQIYEDIGADWFGEGLTAKTVKQRIDGAGKFARISVRINSPGGDAFEGVAIMNLLRAQKKPIDVYVDGIAASAASMVAMAGDTITMGRGAMMMIHNALMLCFGHAKDLREGADLLDQVSASMAQVYVARTGKSAEEIKAMLDAETWMSAQECIDNGFATALVDDDNDDAMALAKTFKSLARLKHVPDSLKAENTDDIDVVQCGCECDACEADDHDECEFDCIPGTMDGAATDSGNLTQYEARLRLLRASGCANADTPWTGGHPCVLAKGHAGSHQDHAGTWWANRHAALI